MSVLHRKLERELWQYRGQILAIALVIAGGVAVCVMALVNYQSLVATRISYYAEQHFADVFVHTTRAPRHLLDPIRAWPGITGMEARIQTAAQLNMPGFDEPVSALVLSLPARGATAVNRLYLHRGRLPDPQQAGDVVVLGGFAQAHQLRLGSSFTAIVRGKSQTLRVVGIAESPEFIYVLPPGAMLPDYQRYGVLWMGEAALAAATDMEGAFNSLALTVNGLISEARLIERLDHLLARYGSTGAYARDDQPSHRFLSDEMKQLRMTAILFPLFFMAVAMFLLNVVVSRLIATQRDIIAILKAFGYSNREVGWHYSQWVLAITALGILLGLLLGFWLGRHMSALYMDYYHFPRLRLHIPYIELVAVALLTFSMAWLGAWRAIRAAVRLPPAEAMLPEAPGRYRATLLERIVGRQRLSQPTRMLLRHVERRPIRSLFGVTGIALSTGVVILGNFQFDSVSFMVHTQFSRVQQQDIAVTFDEALNVQALYALAQHPQVGYVEGRRTLPVRLVNGTARWRGALTGLPRDARLQQVVDDRLQPVPMPSQGVLLTDFLAHRLNLQPGDRVTVEILDGRQRTLQLPVAGITREPLGVGAYMDHTVLSRVLGEDLRYTEALLTVNSPDSDVLHRALRDTPRITAVNGRLAMLNSFYDTLAKTFLTFSFFNSLLGGVIAFGVVYNTVRISLAERSRELASLRVLGYTHGEVAHILLGELAVLLLLGIPLGLLTGLGLAEALASAMQTELYRVPVVISTHTLALAASVVAVSAVLSGLLAWYRLRQLDLVAVLKTRE